MNRGLLIWVGRENKREPEAQLCERYFKRIQPYAKFEQRVIKPLGSGDTATVQKKESEKILSCINSNDFLVCCDERGKQKTSPQLGEFFEERARDGRRTIFVIGGAMGMSDELRQRANFMLSLTSMTLPHALARVILLEQIYRGLCIRAGHPYHHEG